MFPGLLILSDPGPGPGHLARGASGDYGPACTQLTRARPPAGGDSTQRRGVPVSGGVAQGLQCPQEARPPCAQTFHVGLLRPCRSWVLRSAWRGRQGNLSIYTHLYNCVFIGFNSCSCVCLFIFLIVVQVQLSPFSPTTHVFIYIL